MSEMEKEKHVSDLEGESAPSSPATEVVDLALSEGGDDLTALLARREGWRPNRWTWVLIGVLVLGVGFMGGALVAKSLGLSNAASVRFALPGGGAMPNFGSGGAMPNFGSGGFPADMGGSAVSPNSAESGVTGTVKVASKGKLYVTDATGQTIIVTVPASASITVAEPGEFSRLKPGDTVTIQGSKAADGVTMTATSVTSGPGSTQQDGGTQPQSPTSSTSSQPNEGAAQ